MRPVAGDAQRSLILRRVVAGSDARRARRVGSLRRFRRRARHGDRRARGRAARARTSSTAISPSSTGRYRAELDRLGLWDRDLRRALRRRPDRRRPRRLGRPAGLRLRVRGPERGAVALARGVRRPGGRHGVAASTSPGGSAFSSLERTATDLAGLAGGRIEELPPRYGDYAHPALAHLERALFEDVAAAGARRRGRDPLARGRRHPRDARARRRRDPAAPPRRHGARGDPGRLPVGRPRARAARGGVRSARRSVRARRDAEDLRRPPSGARCSRCSATRGSAAAGATCSASCAPRIPGSRVPTPTSSRDGCAAAGSARRSASRRRSSKLRGAAARCTGAPARGTDFDRGRARARRLDAARRLRARRSARVAPRRPDRPAGVPGDASRCWTSSRAGSSSAASSRPRSSSRRSSGRRSARLRRARAT